MFRKLQFLLESDFMRIYLAHEFFFSIHFGTSPRDNENSLENYCLKKKKCKNERLFKEYVFLK